MNNLAVVIIDTYLNKNLAYNALQMALRLPNIKKVYTFSDQSFFPGANFIQIPPIKSNNEYGSVIFDLMPMHVVEDHFLIIQWDGFPLYPENWSEEFLKYDYIGAPLGTWVGNGGFSLRSKKLLGTLKALKIGIELDNLQDQPEDQVICVTNRNLLESKGIQFAPIDKAAQFSYQIGALNHNILGFHSPENLPLFIAEDELVKVADEIIERIASPIIMLRYLQRSIELKFYELLKASVANYTSKPNLIKAVNYELNNNPQSNLLELIISLN